MRSLRILFKTNCGAAARRRAPQRMFAVQANETDDSIISTACNCHVYSSLDNGLLDYSRGWAWQQTILSRRLEVRRQACDEKVHDNDCVLMLEHNPVYTLGRGANEMHLTFLQQEDAAEERQRLARCNRGAGSARLSLDRRMDADLLTRPLNEAIDILADTSVPVIAPNGVPIYRVERGGEVTFHGPGQLVVYPLLDLRRSPLKQDLHWYLRMVEQVIIQTLQHYDIDACRDKVNTGVWVDDCKVAAVGVTASKWITTHGFALNIDPDLSYFDTSNILPCGIEGRGVTSIQQILRQRGDVETPTMKDVTNVVLRNLQEVFDIEIQHAESLW